jgi:hypothetical protein
VREFLIGGCAYRLDVSAHHASAVAALAALSSSMREGPRFSGTLYRHTSNLPQGRALWARDAIREHEVRWAITLDSDTSFYPSDLLYALQRWDQVYGSPAIGIVPVAEGGSGRLNLRVMDDGIPAPLLPEQLILALDGSLEIESGGFGCAILDLDWFRTHWPEPEPEGHGLYTGEDLEFCRSVRRRGGTLRALSVRSTHLPFRSDG